MNSRLNFILYFFIFSCVIFTAFFAHALEINKIRFGQHPDKLRTVIELSKASEFKAFTLPQEKNKPYRIVVDLPSYSWNAGNITLPKNKEVTDVRTSNVSVGTMRIVLDMKNPTILNKAFILPASGSSPTRLVIDSQSVSKNQYDQSKRNIIGDLAIPAKDLNTIIAEQSDVTVNQNTGLDKLKERIGVIPAQKPTTSEANNAASTASPLRKPLIVIDAGHGGADPGAIGSNKSREKDITLAAAKILKKKLDATGRYRTALTRDNDRYIKLSKRVSIARDKEADLFISLHADSINKSNVRGASIYTLSNKASDKQTARLAARENQADLIAGVDLRHEDKEVANILIDLAMRDTMNQSKFFANTVVGNMDKKGVQTLTRPHRYAGFAVLKAPDIPSVLVEMGFMSNSKEAALLATNNYQEKIATALVKSIDTYFSKVRKNAL